MSVVVLFDKLGPAKDYDIHKVDLWHSLGWPADSRINWFHPPCLDSHLFQWNPPSNEPRPPFVSSGEPPLQTSSQEQCSPNWHRLYPAPSSCQYRLVLEMYNLMHWHPPSWHWPLQLSCPCLEAHLHHMKASFRTFLNRPLHPHLISLIWKELFTPVPNGYIILTPISLIWNLYIISLNTPQVTVASSLPSTTGTSTWSANRPFPQVLLVYFMYTLFRFKLVLSFC